ncbi:MAG: DUF87 domain-containing protein [Clostridia bacterium]|nr:DUF87 domain-containing protein [Clostridia bacterium]
MAKKTTANTKNTTKDKRSTAPSAKKTASEKKTASAKPKCEKTAPERQGGAVSIADRMIPVAVGIVGACLVLCFAVPSLCGAIGSFIRNAFFGILGWGCIPVPVFMIALAFAYLKLITPYKKHTHSKIYIKLALASSSVVCLSSFVSIAAFGTKYSASVSQMYNSGVESVGGGAVGGLIAMGLCKCFGILAPVLLFGAALVCALLTFGLTPYRLYAIIKEKSEQAKLARISEQEENEENDDDLFNTDKIPQRTEKYQKPEKKRSKKKDPFDYELDDMKEKPVDDDFDDFDDDDKAYDYEKHNRSEKKNDDADEMGEKEIKKKPVNKTPVTDNGNALHEKKDDKLDLEEIFSDKSAVSKIKPEQQDDELKKTAIGKTAEQLAAEARAYRFPPMSLLKIDYNQQSADISSELEENSRKLINTLASFNVDARVVHISRGPAITRYELKLAPGIRVTAISKLVDNIAMEFAATGVRIEAPIPGKDAVGVEVPNSNIRIVRIRELLDTDKFRSAESKLTCALGVDVVGDPVYLDIAKMPHMLIAGATGMGKSVCINSLLVSLLCKASPDDVKIMLIDPKKVEFVPYSGIPHLIVPVVTDPKKAAGALHWAVEEMERRYGLIESVGCRNIFGYNEVTADDPEKEHLCQVVIVIDELADLMMMAKNDIETSICRIAQKARAAGIHLIVGTQRPSVDIVTGSIKANIPSRIACKTSSQIDSRTIIDIAGAEKLIGRGDMLFAPVGISKPKRVQGAFVSDSEVEAITDFIKKNYGKVSYDEKVIQEIEKGASQVGKGNKTAMFDDDDAAGDEDELLRPAIEYAFESGRVSTSLFQRKLSIGYGRAAKIIDRMQELGICSESSGTKPRELLMTKEEYLEMMNGNGGNEG